MPPCRVGATNAPSRPERRGRLLVRAPLSILSRSMVKVSSSNFTMRRFSGLLLVIALLLGQIGLLEHEYDFAAHQAGDHCVICLHASPLGHAVAGSSAPLFSAQLVQTEFSLRDLTFSSITHAAYRARAPPHVLPV